MKKRSANLGFILFVVTLLVIPLFQVSAISTNLTITAYPSSWTKENVILTATGSGVDKIITPDGAVWNRNTVTYTARNNGAYSFIGLNKEDEVLAIETFVVDYIDRVGKNGNIVPNDGKWRNDNTEVRVNVTN